MKTTLAALGLFAALVISGCGDDDEEGGSTGTPAAACKSLVAEVCSKFFGCYSKEQLDLAASVVGNNEADCRTKFEQSQCSEQMVKCDSGETYSSSKASECLSQFKAFSCAEFGDGNQPAACDTVCE